MKNIVKTALVAIFVAATALAAGCSDGDPWQVDSANPNITTAPQIVRFSADSLSLKAGESTTIHWEAVGADLIQITAISESGGASSFNVETKELSGSTSTGALDATTHFTIAASVSLPVEDSGIVGLSALLTTTMVNMAARLFFRPKN